MTNFEDQLKEFLSHAYDIERELGGGGMSRVFVATDRSLGRKVVIKLLSPELTAEVNRDRFRREMQVAARFQHPHIVPLLSAGEHGEIVYYTMPFVEGESLKSALEKGPFTVREVVRVLNNVVDALGYAHARGVIHRDIKPANILRSGSHSMVTDFGIAKALSASMASSAMTATGTAIGTPAYMSPEQLAGDPAADHRIDIYAAGLLAYELLNGRSPFAALSPQRVMAAIFNVDPKPIDQVRTDVPSRFSTIIMQCLAKNADDRPASADALLDALDGIATGSGQIRTREYKVPEPVAVAMPAALGSSSVDASVVDMSAGALPRVTPPAAAAPVVAAGVVLPEKRSRTGMLIGLAAVLIAGIAAILFFMNNGKTSAVATTATTNQTSLQPSTPAATNPAAASPAVAAPVITSIDSAAIAEAVRKSLAQATAAAAKTPGRTAINTDSLKRIVQKQMIDSIARANAASPATVAAAAAPSTAPVAAPAVAATPATPAAPEWQEKPRLAIAELRDNKEQPALNTFARVIIDGLRSALDKKSYSLVDQDSVKGVTSRTQSGDEAVRMIQPEIFVTPSFATLGDTVRVNVAVRDMRRGSNYGLRVISLKTVASFPPQYYVGTLVEAVMQQLNGLPKEPTSRR